MSHILRSQTLSKHKPVKKKKIYIYFTKSRSKRKRYMPSHFSSWLSRTELHPEKYRKSWLDQMFNQGDKTSMKLRTNTKASMQYSSQVLPVMIPFMFSTKNVINNNVGFFYCKNTKKALRGWLNNDMRL